MKNKSIAGVKVFFIVLLSTITDLTIFINFVVNMYKIKQNETIFFDPFCQLGYE